MRAGTNLHVGARVPGIVAPIFESPVPSKAYLSTVPGNTLHPPPVKPKLAPDIQVRLTRQRSDRLAVEPLRHGHHRIDRKRRHGG